MTDSGNNQSPQALDSLLGDLKDLTRFRAQAARKLLFLVHVDATGLTSCQSFSREEELRSKLMEMIGQDGSVYVFSGERWHITRGRSKYLVTPEGERIPLFSEGETDIDPSGSLLTDLPDQSKPGDSLPSALGIPVV